MIAVVSVAGHGRYAVNKPSNHHHKVTNGAQNIGLSELMTAIAHIIIVQFVLKFNQSRA